MEIGEWGGGPDDEAVRDICALSKWGNLLIARRQQG